MKLFVSILFLSLSLWCTAQNSSKDFQISDSWQSLLDKDLSNWELFVGVPHVSVELEGYEKSENVHHGTPIGLNNDPKNIMTTKEVNGEIVLAITGEIYAGLTTLQEFDNYHLKAEFKWGEKKWEPRLDLKRDNGILYHCKGEHGAFWNVWMQGLECQVQEGDMGDFVALLAVQADITSEETKPGFFQYIPKATELKPHGSGPEGYVHIHKSNEKPNGEWNTVEVIAVKDKSIHIVNGKVVMVVHNARQKVNGEFVPLTNGKIQIQSEGAEAYYKNMVIRFVKDFPKKYKKHAGL